MALDLAHLKGLLFGGEVFVDDADAALLRHGNSQTSLGHGVHRGSHQRQIKRDIARQTGRKGGVLGQDRGEGGNE